jgi:hypothetical protein
MYATCTSLHARKCRYANCSTRHRFLISCPSAVDRERVKICTELASCSQVHNSHAHATMLLIELVAVLLESEALVEACTLQGWRPLHFAAHAGSAQVQAEVPQLYCIRIIMCNAAFSRQRRSCDTHSCLNNQTYHSVCSCCWREERA